jgi:hypothetical protein
LIPDVKSAIENNPNFMLLDEAIQTQLLNTVGNIDLSKLPDDVKSGQTELYDYLKDRYLYPISAAFSELPSDSPEIKAAKLSAKDAFGLIFSEASKEMTGGEYRTYVNDNKKIIEDYFKEIYGNTE